jgi:hypothetical protein
MYVARTFINVATHLQYNNNIIIKSKRDIHSGKKEMTLDIIRMLFPWYPWLPNASNLKYP